MMETLRPRLATVADAGEINAIYNYYVRTSAATFQVDDETTEERVEELRTRPGNQPLIVLEADHGVVGWGALSPFRSRCAYRDTIELTVYVRHDCHRQGYGCIMVQDLVERARSWGVESTYLLWTGEAGKGIVAAAEAERADLIMVGTRGLARAGRWLLGSVSDHVVHHAGCPVLVVR